MPAGQAVSVSLSVPASAALVYYEQGEAVAEGKPVFHVGLGQPDPLTEKLTGKKSVRVEG